MLTIKPKSDFSGVFEEDLPSSFQVECKKAEITKNELKYDESYKNSPYFIQLLSLKNLTDPIEYDIRVTDGGNKVHFKDEDSDSSFTMSFGDTIHTWYGSWVLLKNPNVTENNPKHTLGMVINGWPQTIYTYMTDITALTTTEYVNIIDLSLGGPTPQKNEDILFLPSAMEGHINAAECRNAQRTYP